MAMTTEPKREPFSWRVVVAGAFCGALSTFIILAALIVLAGDAPARAVPWDRQTSAAALATDAAAGRVAALRLVDDVSGAASTGCDGGGCPFADRYLILALYRSGERAAVILPAGAGLPDPSAYGPLELFSSGQRNAAMDQFQQAALAYLAAHQT